MIELKNVSMTFNLSTDRIMSLKEFFTSLVKKKIAFQTFNALQDINIQIQQGEVVGIIGSNGAGKSTLLKIISGIMTPSKGEVIVEGTVSPLLELGAGFDLNLTGRENIFLNGAILGYSKEYLTAHLEPIIEFSELEEFIDTPLRNYSSGMIIRLAFSIATAVNPEILILDEIMAVGDSRFQQKSQMRMNELINGNATVLLVSHDIELIAKTCQRVIWIEHGRIIMDGNVTNVCNAYKEGLQ